ncbi:MAG: putative ubiquitin [Harvfovirus sp.]|uniref:Putative ubiquitin n=1 Tax=Harvfovirus sp. TaxID=2487768 RepID=A0A3G5A2C4_9VIRU|nr:MAG: putative ubiquitin [Harvfovirus sp.]
MAGIITKPIVDSVIKIITLTGTSLYAEYKPAVTSMDRFMDGLFENYDIDSEELCIYSHHLKRDLTDADMRSRMSDFKFPKTSELQIRIGSTVNEYLKKYIKEKSEASIETPLIAVTPKLLNIKVITDSGKIFDIAAYDNESVYNVKCRVEELADMFNEKYDLTFENKFLSRWLTLKDHNIKDGECLHLTYSGEKSIQIFIRSFSGKTLTLDIYQNDDVEQIKIQIYNKEGVVSDKQRLVFAGRQLQNGQTLADYNIRGDATIHLCLRLGGGMFHETSGRNGGYKELQSIYFVIKPDFDK